MKSREPKFMRDLHKVREKLGKHLKRLSTAQKLKEINTAKPRRFRQKAA